MPPVCLHEDPPVLGGKRRDWCRDFCEMRLAAVRIVHTLSSLYFLNIHSGPASLSAQNCSTKLTRNSPSDSWEAHVTRPPEDATRCCLDRGGKVTQHRCSSQAWVWMHSRGRGRGTNRLPQPWQPFLRRRHPLCARTVTSQLAPCARTVTSPPPRPPPATHALSFQRCLKQFKNWSLLGRWLKQRAAHLYAPSPRAVCIVHTHSERSQQYRELAPSSPSSPARRTANHAQRETPA